MTWRSSAALMYPLPSCEHAALSGAGTRCRVASRALTRRCPRVLLPALQPPSTTNHMQAGEAAGALTKQRKWRVTVKKPGSKFLYYLLCLLSYDKVTAISQIFENEVTDGEAGR